MWAAICRCHDIASFFFFCPKEVHAGVAALPLARSGSGVRREAAEEGELLVENAWVVGSLSDADLWSVLGTLVVVVAVVVGWRALGGRQCLVGVGGSEWMWMIGLSTSAAGLLTP